MFKKFRPTALPWILFVLGIVCLSIGAFIPDDDIKYSHQTGKLLVSIGSSILASGIFALMLKSIQFLGVFKEELNDVIFDTKFLKNRVDLPQYWEKVTRELVKNKFPTIHNGIMKDVKEQYLPTTIVQYYDNFSNVLEIELIDPEKKLIEVKHRQTFTIIPGEQNKPFQHPFTNRITIKDGCEDSSCEINYVKVNDRKVDITVSKSVEEGSLITKGIVELDGTKNGYNVEMFSTRRYLLDVDNIIGYVNNYIQNNYKVQIILKGVRAKFFECGTLNKFETNHDRETLIEKQYKGIMYKGQGYIVFLYL